MKFKDKPNGDPAINPEQKIRITLSPRAQAVMAEDMDVFKVDKSSTFINTVFANYKDNARSSVFNHLQQRKLELDRILSASSLDKASKEIAIKQLLESEKEAILDKVSEYTKIKGDSKIYHLNKENYDFIIEECEEQEYYNTPVPYISSVVEEYCSLPFIKRERIYRKDIYETVERACSEKRKLKIKANYYDKEQVFIVYPYKIVPDPFHTQSYMVCYSFMAEEDDSKKIVASFSMARLNTPTMLRDTFHLSKKERDNIEDQLSKYSPAYLVGKPEQIKVKLTKNGKRSYQSQLYSRPEKIASLSTDDIYVFNCTPLQAYNYFYPFGADAEILSPEDLRNRFVNTMKKAIDKYNKA